MLRCSFKNCIRVYYQGTSLILCMPGRDDLVHRGESDPTMAMAIRPGEMDILQQLQYANRGIKLGWSNTHSCMLHFVQQHLNLKLIAYNVRKVPLHERSGTATLRRHNVDRSVAVMLGNIQYCEQYIYNVATFRSLDFPKYEQHIVGRRKRRGQAPPSNMLNTGGRRPPIAWYWDLLSLLIWFLSYFVPWNVTFSVPNTSLEID